MLNTGTAVRCDSAVERNCTEGFKRLKTAVSASSQDLAVQGLSQGLEKSISILVLIEDGGFVRGAAGRVRGLDTGVRC